MNTPKIAIIGLGYVGLPLAAAFASKYEVVGFDINTTALKFDELSYLNKRSSRVYFTFAPVY